MREKEEVPEEFRCKRSDGKQWRCSARSMPDKTVCEKHYNQAKKRAANSAMRASQRRVRMRQENGDDITPENMRVDTERQHSNNSGGELQNIQANKKPKGKSSKNHVECSPASPLPQTHTSNEDMDLDTGRSQSLEGEDDLQNCQPYTPPKSKCTKVTLNKLPKEAAKNNNPGEKEVETISCHFCHKNNKGKMVACLKCKRRSYCVSCISKWYPGQTQEDIKKACPACKRICKCEPCLQEEERIKLQQAKNSEKIRLLHYMLSTVLPILREIHKEQCSEIEAETKIQGHPITLSEIPKAKLGEDEILACNRCYATIVDYHRNCPTCAYDLCLACCRELREKSQKRGVGDFNSTQLQEWKARYDGSIACEQVGCGNSLLILKRICKVNWIGKIEKDAEEMASSCKISDNITYSSPCSSCYKHAVYSKKGCPRKKSLVAAHRKDSDDNILYCPTSQDIKKGGLQHFQKHWIKGHPVVVQNVIDDISGLSWNPLVMWDAFQESQNGKLSEGTTIAKAINCLSWSDIEVSVRHFFRGYFDTKMHRNGMPELLKLKDWPPTKFLEEYLPSNHSGFIKVLPFSEYTNPESGVLNMASKRQVCYSRMHLGPKIDIAYGMLEELGQGDSVTKLHCQLNDVASVLVHTAEANSPAYEQLQRDKCQNPFRGLNSENVSPDEDDDGGEEHCWDLGGGSYDRARGASFSETNDNREDPAEASYGGAVWDIFRREDVPKLKEYMQKHLHVDSISSIHGHIIYLNKDHKRKLKEEYQVEPWTFEQNLGEAVLVPAGCPYQVRNLKVRIWDTFK
eukprot:TRINITY_DN10647_c0_g1_i2.p1 TRINITY_DN10647_c0_g1~~TRINITY_DN10647_c0_g1_i2.p1  ORF type:complete len:799 (-),score=160.22 TRINITY_DN10647_c0_g1_i2:16-2412(-)